MKKIYFTTPAHIGINPYCKGFKKLGVRPESNMLSEKIEEFVAQAFENAIKVAPNHWVAGGQEAVSYEEEGHDENATYEDRSFWFQQRNVLFRELIERFSIEQLIQNKALCRIDGQ